MSQEFTHKKGMPLGWVNRDGKTMPCFVCSHTGKPITPQNPGMIYWNRDTGDILVLSDKAEDQIGVPDGYDVSVALGEYSLYLFRNTVGPDGSQSQARTRELAAINESLVRLTED